MSTIMQQQVACNATKKYVTFFATLSDKNLKLKRLGDWVKKHREMMKYSQETAAEKSGLSRYQWLRIENGQSGTKRETILTIAKELNADKTEGLALLAGLEPQNANDTLKVTDEIGLIFSSGTRKITKKQKEEIRQMTNAIAQVVLAKNEEEEEEEKEGE